MAKSDFESDLSVIKDAFVHVYFGHVSTCSPLWNELVTLISNLKAKLVRKGADLEIIASAIIDIVKNHELNRFPVAKAHYKSVMEWLNNQELGTIKACFENESDNNNDKAEYAFKTSPCHWSTKRSITLLEEYRNIYAHGTTGLSSWQGGVFLSAYLINNEAFVNEKRILELGSGTGFLGLSLLSLLNPSSYVFTDCHERVLDILQLNVNLNMSNETMPKAQLEAMTITGPPSKVAFEGDERVRVRSLDWTKINDDKLLAMGQVEVILGSDIVYERSVLSDLCRTVSKLFELNAACVALIACTERRHSTLECFEQALNAEQLQHKIVCRGNYGVNDLVLASDVGHRPIRIYRIERSLEK